MSSAVPNRLNPHMLEVVEGGTSPKVAADDASWVPLKLSHIERLKQMALKDPKRVERALNALWQQDRSLMEDIVADGAESLVTSDETGCARLSGCKIAVWEVVREHRKLGSVDRLCRAFPTLSVEQIDAALDYALSHPGDIEERIVAFEDVLVRRRSAYPFSS